MSNIVKTKFAGLLRGLLRRFESNELPSPELPRPVAAAAPPAAAPSDVDTTNTQSQSSELTSPPAPVETKTANADELELPLQPILSALPMDLRAKVIQSPPPGSTLVISIEKILSQLAHGSVKITFGELRQAAGAIFVHSGGENDSRPVALPLNEIFARLNPALLSRRAAQKKVEVADEIAGPFAANAKGISFTTAPLKSATPTPPLTRFATPVSKSPTAPLPVTPPMFAPRGITPAPSTPTLPPSRNGNGHGAPHLPISPMTPSPIAPAAPLPKPEALRPAISVPLSSLTETWPDGLKLEIAQLNLAEAQVALPVDLIEPSLKRGRVTLAWKNLRAWIKPMPPGVSIHDGVELELPLKVIAPLYFAQQKSAGKPQQKLSVTSEIPNLFFGFPQPQPDAPAPRTDTTHLPIQTIQPAVQPVLPVQPMDVVKPAAVKLPETNFYFSTDNAPKADETDFKRPQMPATDFSHRQATPDEIIERAMALSGVAGALVALPDGLKVASQTPPDVNADTLAAFLPQIFERVSQSTKELRSGSLNNLSFTVGNVLWKIFRVNAVYFAAFSRDREQLPTAQLAALATQLDRKKQ